MYPAYCSATSPADFFDSPADFFEYLLNIPHPTSCSPLCSYPRTRQPKVAEIRELALNLIQGPCWARSQNLVAANRAVSRQARSDDGVANSTVDSGRGMLGDRSRRRNRGAMTRHGPRLAVATLPWPGTRSTFLLLNNNVSPDDRGYKPREIRGPCCAISRDLGVANQAFSQ